MIYITCMHKVCINYIFLYLGLLSVKEYKIGLSNWGGEGLKIEISKANIDDAQTLKELQKKCFEEDME